jgi:hypothetical protein
LTQKHIPCNDLLDNSYYSFILIMMKMKIQSSFSLVALLLFSKKDLLLVSCKKNAAAAARASRSKRRGATITKKPLQQRSTSAINNNNNKAELNKQLANDPADLLGDAIRDRADQVRNDSSDSESSSSLYQSLEGSVHSVGWALGASDFHKQDAGGVEAVPTAVIANYFLKSHGGAHAVQSVLSFLATMAGLGSLMLHNSKPATSLSLLRRACVFAMLKHISGLIAAAVLAAQAIPMVGLSKARIWMQEIAVDPVSHYVFYAACMVVWLPQAASLNKYNIWWQHYAPRTTTFLIVGPVLLRELVSTALVISDVLVLWAFSSHGTMARSLFNTASRLTRAVMSVLVTPRAWNTATAAERQAILAKLVAQTSLCAEVAVGALLTADAGRAIIEFLFFANHRPDILQVGKRFVCAMLYVQFLWTRRQMIRRLAVTVRGGASELPFYVLDVLLHPKVAMGMDLSNENEKQPTRTWMDYVIMALGLDE